MHEDGDRLHIVVINALEIHLYSIYEDERLNTAVDRCHTTDINLEVGVWTTSIHGDVE